MGLIAPRRNAFAARAWPIPEGFASAPSDARGLTYDERSRIGGRFRALAVATVVSIFTLVILGGVVRLTGSGLGCPDWPLCHGKVIPPLHGPTLVEYSHRLMASIAGVLVVATAVIVWKDHRQRPWLLVPATLGVGILLVQVVLGGLTVLNELSAGLVLAHLATAEALIASMIVVCVVALRGRAPVTSQGQQGSGLVRLQVVTLGALPSVYAVLLTGSYVTVSGATPACGEWWPLCNGGLLPEGYYPTIHMIHRVVAMVAGLMIVAVVALACRRRYEWRALGWAAALVGALFLAQVIVGASILWLGFPMASRLLHLSMGTLVWAALAATAVLVLTAPKVDLRGALNA